MDDLHKPDIDPQVNEKSAASSNEVGYSSIQVGALKKLTRISSNITVVVSGLALFSDGYNAQIIGYMEPLFTDLYKEGMSDTIKTRLPNSCTYPTFQLQSGEGARLSTNNGFAQI